MISSITASRRSFWRTSGACCVESTTASMPTGRSLSYANVSWLLASGLSQGSFAWRPLRILAWRSTSLCA
jgi:hypothetical protein